MVMYMAGLFIKVLIALCFLCGVPYVFVHGHLAVHFSAAIRTGTYDNTSVREFATLSSRMSLIQCIKRCEATRSCMFVNYNQRMKTCYLIECEECSLVQSLQLKGLCYWNKSECNSEEEPLCNSCMPYDECDSSQMPSCLPQGCGIPVHIPYTVRKGNMFSTNNMIRYECMDNLPLTGNVTYSTCQADGYWAPVDLTCGSIMTMCVPPSNITNTTIIGMKDTYIEGDIIHYQCDEALVMMTGNISFSVCLANGLWSTVNFQCEAECMPPVPYTLAADSTFKYLVVFMELTMADALTYCGEVCGTLLQINSTNKFQTMQTAISSNTVYNQADYWVDGYYNSTVSEWRLSSDGTIPRTVAIFKNVPAMDGTPPCVRMREQNNFQLYDFTCSTLLRSICEQLP